MKYLTFHRFQCSYSTGRPPVPAGVPAASAYGAAGVLGSVPAISAPIPATATGAAAAYRCPQACHPGKVELPRVHVPQPRECGVKPGICYISVVRYVVGCLWCPHTLFTRRPTLTRAASAVHSRPGQHRQLRSVRQCARARGRQRPRPGRTTRTGGAGAATEGSTAAKSGSRGSGVEVEGAGTTTASTTASAAAGGSGEVGVQRLHLPQSAESRRL